MILTRPESSLSHDIKQPINVIRLAVGNLSERISREDIVDRTYCIRKLAKIEGQIDQITKMLESVIDQ